MDFVTITDPSRPLRTAAQATCPGGVALEAAARATVHPALIDAEGW